MTAKNLSKQQALDADPKDENATVFFIINEVKESTFYFHLEPCCEFILFYFNINIKLLNITR